MSDDVTGEETGDETPDRGGSLSIGFERALDATDTIVWEADLDATDIEHIGPVERVTGLSSTGFSDFIDLSSRLVHPDDRSTVVREVERLLDGEAETVDSEFRTNPENGTVRWLRTQASVEQRDGRLTVVGLSTDITPLKEREARLEEFAGIVSHDLRNPLSVATARLELAQEAHDSEHLAHAQQALDRMEQLIQNLLTLARTDGDPGNRTPVSLPSVVHAAWESVDTAEASLVVDTDRTVEANRTRLQQLFENLVRNAVEHNPTAESDGLTVRVGPLDGGFFVEDNGVGIPPDRRENLFTGSRSEFTGLGLRIVQRVVEAHGWTIEAAESDDGGARFEIRGVEFP